MKRIILVVIAVPVVIVVGMALAWGVGEVQAQLKTYPLAAEPPNWLVLSNEQYPTIVTRDADGARRITTLWIATVKDRAYLRTNNSVWLSNLQRVPQLELRIGGFTYPCSTTNTIISLDCGERDIFAVNGKGPS